jgi:hypothetical protein
MMILEQQKKNEKKFNQNKKKYKMEFKKRKKKYQPSSSTLKSPNLTLYLARV